MKRAIFNFQFSFFNSNKASSGQALVMLLFFVLIGFTIIFAAAVMVFGNSSAASITEQGNYAYYIAESGVEEGLLKLLRNPSYTGTPANQPLSVGGGSVVIEVSNGLITATGTYNNVVRKIQAQTVYNNYVLTISSWKEVY